jgi:hypothetical protein
MRSLIARRTALRLHRAFQKKARHSPWDAEHAFVDSGQSEQRARMAPKRADPSRFAPPAAAGDQLR